MIKNHINIKIAAMENKKERFRKIRIWEKMKPMHRGRYPYGKKSRK